jgi:hypothetical protein
MTSLKKETGSIESMEKGETLFSLDPASGSDSPIVIVYVQSVPQAIGIIKGLTHKPLLNRLMEMIKDSSVTQEVIQDFETLAASNNVIALILKMSEVPELKEKLQQMAA